MKYRKLDSNGDYVYGHGDADFYVDVQAVAQAILTSLNLFQGEWFLDLTAGVPYFTEVAGFNTQDIYDTIIKDAALGVEGVLSISNYQSSLDRVRRQLSVSLNAQTIFGSVSVSTTTTIQTGYGLGGYGRTGYGE